MFVGSFESELTEQCEGKSIKSHSRPNLVFAQFSVLCMFNWMLGQLRKAVRRSFLEGRSYIRGKASNLNRLSSVRGKHKTSPSAQFSVRAILSRVYIQLDARPIEKDCREIVCSWKSSDLKSAEQCEGKCYKPSPSAQ